MSSRTQSDTGPRTRAKGFARAHAEAMNTTYGFARHRDILDPPIVTQWPPASAPQRRHLPTARKAGRRPAISPARGGVAIAAFMVIFVLIGSGCSGQGATAHPSPSPPSPTQPAT